METPIPLKVHGQFWNKGKLVGQKPPLRLTAIWAIRVRLERHCRSAPGSRPLRPGDR